MVQKTRKTRIRTKKTGLAGRPAILITEKVIKDVTILAAVGMTWDMIAAKTSIGKTTLQKSQKIKDAYHLGRANSAASVGSVAYKMAMSGKSADMTKFWLKTQCGWKENDEQKIEVNVNNESKESAVDIIQERLNKLAIASEKAAKTKKKATAKKNPKTED